MLQRHQQEHARFMIKHSEYGSHHTQHILHQIFRSRLATFMRHVNADHVQDYLTSCVLSDALSKQGHCVRRRSAHCESDAFPTFALLLIVG